MKTVSCSQVIPGSFCSHQVSGETTDEIYNALMDHAMRVHTNEVASMTETQKTEMKQQIDSIA